MKILRINDVTEMVGCSRSTVRRLELLGKFPKRRRISSRLIGWLDFEIEEWLRA